MFSFCSLKLFMSLWGHSGALLDERHIDSHVAHRANPLMAKDLLQEERAPVKVHKHVIPNASKEKHAQTSGNGKMLVRREYGSTMEINVVTAQKKRANATRVLDITGAGAGSGSGSGSGAGKEGCENINKIAWMKWQAGAACQDGVQNTLKGHFDTPWNEETPMILAEYKGTCTSGSLDNVNYCTGQGGGGPGMFVPFEKVENIPKCDGTDTAIVKLVDATKRTITFAEPIVGLILVFISLNGNGWNFDFDFDILLSGDGGNKNGYFGPGTSSKKTEGGKYKLEGTGEPHGMLEFKMAIKELSWNSQANENWNGFSFGIRSGLNGFTCDNGEYEVEEVIMPGNKKEKSGFEFVEASARVIARIGATSLVALMVNLMLCI